MRMSEWKPLILIVEDDGKLARLNARFLTRNGYDALIAPGTAEARALAREHRPDLFVLDVILPDGDGFSLCEEFRGEGDAPVLFLTGEKELASRMAGLGAGGDYYLTKPFDRDEFLAVVQSLLRRAHSARKKIAEAAVVARGPLELQIACGRAFVNGRDAELSQKEFAVLLMLVQNEGRELSGEAIYESVWGTPMNDDSGALRRHISSLKKKLDEENAGGFSILAGYGRGYTFTARQ
jgi:DNA-binding response OmpR family regulator